MRWRIRQRLLPKPSSASSEDEAVLNLNISSSLIDTDTSETQTIFIGNLTGASLSAGTMLNNVWTLDPSQLSGLKLTPTIHSDLEFTIKVTTPII